jgi:hypothetical protein
MPNGSAFVPSRPSVFSLPTPITTPTSADSSKRPSALFYNPLEFDDESADGKEGRMESVRRLQKSYYVNEPGIATLKHGVLSSLPLWMEDYVSAICYGIDHAMIQDKKLCGHILKFT